MFTVDRPNFASRIEQLYLPYADREEVKIKIKRRGENGEDLGFGYEWRKVGRRYMTIDALRHEINESLRCFEVVHRPGGDGIFGFIAKNVMIQHARSYAPISQQEFDTAMKELIDSNIIEVHGQIVYLVGSDLIDYGMVATWRKVTY